MINKAKLEVLGKNTETTFLSLITPLNLVEERKKFFANKLYNPIFNYSWNKGKINAYLKLNPDREALLKAVITQDLEKIVSHAKVHFATQFDNKTIAKARTIVKTKPKTLFKPNVQGFVNKFEKALSYFDIDYKVLQTHKHGYNFRPHHKDRLMQVSSYAHRDYFSLDGSVKHEMVHVIRAVNTRFNKIVKTKNFLPTEEGLACFMQDYHGKFPNNSRFQHAAEFLTSFIGTKSSLRAIYLYLRGLGFSKELAWQRAVRHKFGFVETKLPGDIIKPAMYFYHAQKMKKLESQQLLRLFVGKIALTDMKKYKSYKGKISSEKIINFFNLSK